MAATLQTRTAQVKERWAILDHLEAAYCTSAVTLAPRQICGHMMLNLQMMAFLVMAMHLMTARCQNMVALGPSIANYTLEKLFLLRNLMAALAPCALRLPALVAFARARLQQMVLAESCLLCLLPVRQFGNSLDRLQ